jgi:hypothetical protein
VGREGWRKIKGGEERKGREQGEEREGYLTYMHSA